MMLRLLALSLLLLLLAAAAAAVGGGGGGGGVLFPGRALRDGETLISSGGTFVLGFFSPGSSTRRYLGIWYNHIPVQTVVWVANRHRPLASPSGLLTLTLTGNLTLLDSTTGTVAWSAIPDPPVLTNPVAELLDTGNLIIRHVAAPTAHAWQSFDCPTDTWLPGMKFSSKQALGLTSWRDADDASPGDYTAKIDSGGLPQMFLWGRSAERLYRTGPWNGLRLSGTPEMKSYTTYFSYAFVSDENETYYEHKLHDPTLITRLVIDPTGSVQRYIWVNRTSSWNVYWSAPRDQCDVYAACGAYGVCNAETSPVCHCIKGFVANRTGSGPGCERRTGLRCGDRDGFRKVTGLKLPDTRDSFVNRSMGLAECRAACTRDCACVAYSSANISGSGSGCVMWVHELMDLREFNGGGQDIFVRVAASELDGDDDGESNGLSRNNKLIITVSALASFSFVLLISCLYFLWKIKIQGKAKVVPSENLSLLSSGSLFIGVNSITSDGTNSAELSSFRYDTLFAATDEFSDINILGEGGFGQVYKAKLSNGQEVAVKKLSCNSRQGLEEFKNELMLIARLQHVNLVRLLGYCAQGEENMLIYEYMSNGSLDSFIFDPAKATILDWGRRMRIISGVVQGLLYLHKYSRLRVIHRDIKASNILLDGDLEPKISDFGTAKIFEGNENQGVTKRVIGTYGYMPPEYALHGYFSEKSDVFSFGVLLLEILSGRKNVGFRQGDSWSLLSYASKLWEEGKAPDLADPVLGGSYSEADLLKCIHVGLLCVQQSIEDRPTMSSILSLLNGSSSSLPAINQLASNFTSSTVTLDCSNDVTMTMIEGR